ncbi:hypothetical protein [Roseibacillus persicicus]|uniref:hypothetical protein n=1 Tax=Roseibacillus persicicus TaxID=454148 RepID=UPI0028101363|nr:hypothetical protein [Roseibacillus persicicus]MDQ8191494.1 hypothetical protein [Roseibacillus persicicus]
MQNHTPLLLLGASLGLIQGARIFSHRDHDLPPNLAEWPSHFEGAALHLIEPTEFEKSFADNFPGDIATFRSAGRQIILRRATRGTRRLHASETCLRAAGYEISSRKIDLENWLTYYAKKNDQILHVREQITDGSRNWNSPSPWFWHATLNPKSGPWIATTVITPVKSL